MTSQVILYPDISALSQAAAERFAQAAAAAVRERGRFAAVLSGGSTPEQLFRLLAQPSYRTALPWAQTHFYWADERCVPPDDPGSNYGQAHALLLAGVPVPEGNLHRVKGELAPEAAAVDYVRQLEAIQPLHFDLALLGLGADGHTASLFPGQIHPAEGSTLALAVSGDYQGRPARRVTLTPLALNATREVIFLVSGAGKAAALAATLAGPHDALHWPAQRIQPRAGRVVWMVDRDAASDLPPGMGTSDG